jgi:hypothetical protein
VPGMETDNFLISLRDELAKSWDDFDDGLLCLIIPEHALKKINKYSILL